MNGRENLIPPIVGNKGRNKLRARLSQLIRNCADDLLEFSFSYGADFSFVFSEWIQIWAVRWTF